MVIVLEVGNLRKAVVNFLLLKKLFKRDELHFLEIVLCKTSLRDYHVFMRVPIFKLNDFPVVRVERACLVHVAKLLGHFSVNSIVLFISIGT